jgi:hypothetical protein
MTGGAGVIDGGAAELGRPAGLAGPAPVAVADPAARP